MMVPILSYDGDKQNEDQDQQDHAQSDQCLFHNYGLSKFISQSILTLESVF